MMQAIFWARSSLGRPQTSTQSSFPRFFRSARRRPDCIGDQAPARSGSTYPPDQVADALVQLAASERKGTDFKLLKNEASKWGDDSVGLFAGEFHVPLLARPGIIVKS